MERRKQTKILIFESGILLMYFSLVTLVDTLPFPGIFPLLSTGWYYKPGPTESIVLGLLVVKLLALRLGATVAGVPYHLNDIFDNNILPFGMTRGKRSYLNKNGNKLGRIPMLNEEIEVLERILLALRRIDSHDCFIRYVCQINQNNLDGKQISFADKTWLSVFNLRPVKELNSSSNPTSIWSIYDEALTLKPTNCSEKYNQCPLTEMDLTKQSIMSGLF